VRVLGMFAQRLSPSADMLRQLLFEGVGFLDVCVHPTQYIRHLVFAHQVHLEANLADHVQAPKVLETREVRHGVVVDKEGVCRVEDWERLGTQLPAGSGDAEELVDRVVFGAVSGFVVELDIVAGRHVAELRGDGDVGTECVAIDAMAQFTREVDELGERHAAECAVACISNVNSHSRTWIPVYWNSVSHQKLALVRLAILDQNCRVYARSVGVGEVRCCKGGQSRQRVTHRKLEKV